MTPANPGPAAQRYAALEQDRQPFLDRARECSRLTIPSLLPPNGHSPSQRLPVPFQSLGARGVNNLASKLLLTLLPPSSAFFRLTLADEAEEAVADEEESIVDNALAGIEQKVLKEVERRSLRTSVFEALKHLIVSGNVLLHLPPKGVRVYPMSQYVVLRDGEGTVLEIVVKESLSPLALPKSIQPAVRGQMKPDDKSVDVYTHIVRTDTGWHVYQEAVGIKIPKSVGTYPTDKCPWLALRWTRIDGESWGRGMCEEYLGALTALDSLEEAILGYAAAASKVVFLRNPSGLTSKKQFAEAKNFAIIDGQKDDITTVALEKTHDLSVAKAKSDDIANELRYAFLLNSAIQRNGERVTAEEIRTMANEIENALGGVYSVLSAEFQLPLVTLLLNQMQREGRLPPMPEGTVEPTIVTGIDALGRNHELARLDDFLGGALSQFGPQVLEHVNVSEYLRRRAAARGIKLAGLVRSEEEVQKQRQQMMMASMVDKAVGPGIKAASDQMLAARQEAAAAQAQPQPQ